MTTSRLETTILRNLVHNEDYMRKVLPFVKSEYFTDEGERTIYKLISEFVVKYNKPPTTEALGITLQNSNLPEGVFKETIELVKELEKFEKPNQDWLIDETEKFCKDKAVGERYLSTALFDGMFTENESVQ